MASRGNQVCLAHLLRDVRYLADLEKEEFAKQFKQLLIKVFELKREMSDKNEICSKEKAEELENKLNKCNASIISFKNNFLPRINADYADKTKNQRKIRVYPRKSAAKNCFSFSNIQILNFLLRHYTRRIFSIDYGIIGLKTK